MRKEICKRQTGDWTTENGQRKARGGWGGAEIPPENILGLEDEGMFDLFVVGENCGHGR